MEPMAQLRRLHSGTGDTELVIAAIMHQGSKIVGTDALRGMCKVKHMSAQSCDKCCTKLACWFHDGMSVEVSHRLVAPLQFGQCLAPETGPSRARQSASSRKLFSSRNAQAHVYATHRTRNSGPDTQWTKPLVGEQLTRLRVHAMVLRV